MRYALPSSTARIRHSSGQLSGTRCATALVRMLLTVFVASFGSFAVSAGAVEATSGASRPPVIRLGMMAFTSEGEYSTHVEAEDRMLAGMAAILNERVPQSVLRRSSTEWMRFKRRFEAKRWIFSSLRAASFGKCSSNTAHATSRRSSPLRRPIRIGVLPARFSFGEIVRI